LQRSALLVLPQTHLARPGPRGGREGQPPWAQNFQGPSAGMFQCSPYVCPSEKKLAAYELGLKSVPNSRFLQ
jgi:hypothetical protein